MYKNVKELAKAEGIKLETELMSQEMTEAFIRITIMANDKDFQQEFNSIMDENVKTPSIFALAHKRWEAYEMQDKIDRSVMFLVDIFAQGVPGHAVFMLIDMLNHCEDTKKKVTLDTVAIEMYPNGFYTANTVQTLVDEFVKTNKLRNSEIY